MRSVDTTPATPEETLVLAALRSLMDEGNTAVSASTIARAARMGYARAARILRSLEAKSLVEVDLYGSANAFPSYHLLRADEVSR